MEKDEPKSILEEPSSILPRYMRHIPSIDNLIPVLYYIYRGFHLKPYQHACNCLAKDKDVLFTFYDFLS